MPKSTSISAGHRLTMIDLARLAGVAPSTISRALADSPEIPAATKNLIRGLAEEHGYVINDAARRLRQNKALTIGIAVPLGPDGDQLATEPFLLELFGRVSDQILQRNYSVLLTAVAAPTVQWFSQQIQSQRADGYIVLGLPHQQEILSEVTKKYLPVVAWGAHLPGQGYCSVGSDNIGGGQIATAHLVQSGCRRIAFVGPTDHPEVQMRLDGYKMGLQKAGLPVDPELIISVPFAGSDVPGAISNLVARGVTFDAILAASDRLAIAALKGLQSCRLSCPQDVSVIGFDDLEIAEFAHPALTTVRQNMRGAAATMVDLLFRRIAGEATPSATLPVELVVRESTITR